MKRTGLVVAVVLALPLLTGCAPEGISADPPDTPTPSATQSDTPSPTPTAGAGPVFTAPTSCSQLVGAALETDFATRKIVLFDSTNGEGEYAPTGVDNQQNAGDPFSCLYGIPMVDLNSFVLTVQPVTQDEHEGIVAVLGAAGFEVTTDGDVVTYTRVGAETGQTADQLLIHVLRPDSWMTGWASLGGEPQRVRISGYLDQVAANLYK